MILLVDVGNSRIKWTTFADQQLGVVQALSHRESAQLIERWANLETPQAIWISQVGASEAWQTVLDWISRNWSQVPVERPRAQAYQLGVHNAYQQPEKLGIDRWLTLLASHHHYTGNLCVVDCGTALTIDILNSQGQHQGGLIAPGFTLMQQSLARNTAALPDVSESIAQAELAVVTQQAIANGSLMAVIGCIESCLTRLNQPVQIVMTGGDAVLVANALTTPIILDPQLVFKGLALLSQQGSTC